MRCLIVARQDALPGRTVPHIKRRRLQNETASNKYCVELDSYCQIRRAHGGYGYCHLWVKASSSRLMSGKIRLFDMLPLFQVRLTGQDCERISHKDFKRSAERQTQAPSKPSSPVCPLGALRQAADAFFRVDLAPSGGTCEELQGSICLFVFVLSDSKC